MSFPRYSKYKPSGVEWLGDVPEGWVVCAPKRRIKSAAGGTLIKGMCSDEFSEGLFPGFSASGQNVWLEEYAYDCPAIVLSAVGARCGKSFKADGHWGVVANTHCLFPLPNSDRDYLWYLTNQEDWWEKGGSAQPFVKVSETMARPWVFPPLPEQTAIAEFLDRETAKIDGLVAEQRRLMELLKEKRQAVISHAVTKGLNPHAPMKPSGIEWLGDVPAGWEVKRLKHLGESIIGLTYSPADIVYEGTGTLVLRSSNVQGGKIVFDDNVYVATAIPEALVTQVGDILICSRNGSRALIGKNAMIDETSAGLTFGAFMTIFRSQHSGYISCVLNSPLFEFQSGAFMTSTINQLTIGVLNNFEVPFPPPDERERIVKFLQTETARFDTLTAEAQRAIDLLQERRTALISAAVTGQIDVRQHPKN